MKSPFYLLPKSLSTLLRSVAAIILFASLAQAAAIDLQVSSYTLTPDPVVKGGTVTLILPYIL